MVPGDADYVIASLTAQIDAFTAVTGRMRDKLANLPAAERAEVEDASRLLRRARAGRQLPVIALTPARPA